MKRDHRTISRDGVALCAESFGDVRDPAIVLIMGATQSMMGWPDQLCEAIASSGTFVIRFDQRDTGASTTVPPDAATYSMEDLADDVVRILDGYDVHEAHVLGFSQGGMIAQMTALRHPSVVLTLTLLASLPLGGEQAALTDVAQSLQDHVMRSAEIDWRSSRDVEAFLLRSAELCASETRGCDPVLTQERIGRELRRSGSLRSALNHVTITPATQGWNLQDIEAPALIIHGAQDRLLPISLAEALEWQLKSPAFHVLPDAGHDIHSDDIDVIAALVSDHVRTSEQLPA